MSNTTTLSPPREGRTRSRRSIALAALASVGAAVAFAVPTSPAAAADFNADPGSLGQIPDNAGSLDVTFNVSGTAGAISGVELSLTLGHQRVADLRGTLIAPNGTSLLIFGPFDDGPVGTPATGTYRLTDSAPATPTWRGAIASTLITNLAEGDYRGSNAGGANILITPAFAGLANANGTWTLRLEDAFANRTGGIGAATLDIDTAKCDGQPATIAGTDAADVIFGTAGNDVIVAGGGDDVIRGFGGDDIICGGDGNDKLKAGAGDDRLFGEAGSDKLRGGLDSDYCNGGSSRDSAKKCEKSKSI